MSSTRLPKKVLRPVHGTPLIALLLERLARAETIDEIVIATSVNPANDDLETAVRALGYRVYRGSENDVLDRYRHAAEMAEADVVVRVTGDCPLIDPAVVDEVVRLRVTDGVDYASNTITPTYPDGLDTEAFSRAALETAWREATSPYDREHVTPFLKTSPQFTRSNLVTAVDRSADRWTVDEPEDLDVVSRVVAHFHPRHDFTWTEVIALQDRDATLFDANRHHIRNAGATMGTGQKLWKRAQRVIPGGSMLLSKRAEMFLPEQWPSYYSKTQGCRVWDLDGNEFLDMSLMGIGSNSLGYNRPEVDDAVRKVIDAGNLSTFNCPEEVYLAEKLIEMHPWADMARLARSGGEANSIAIRIARASSGRDIVAICGYHGWHDWYLAANLGDKDRLTGHLLPGLDPAGVPQELRGSVVPFQYNDFAGFDKVIAEHPVGVIKMEVSRNTQPAPGFLEHIRKVATEKGIVLVFDECTSGFRQTFGGLHKMYHVEPDVAVFGKTLGNGYAITAVIGRRSVMQAAQSTFISSTFWTERIGPAAALATLEVMERIKSWDTITERGFAVTRGWQELATRHGVPITTNGLPALPGFAFTGEDSLKYKTLLTQEMLKKGMLATTAMYLCTEHTPELIQRYMDNLDGVFALIKQCQDGVRKVDELLEGPVCHSGFRRLN